MGVVVDLLSGQVFLFDSSGGGGGGGTGITMPYPEVNFYSELPDPTITGSTGKIYVVHQGMGAYTADRLDGGLYYSNGVTWSRLGLTPAYFNDNNFNLYNGTDKTKKIRFELSGNTSGTTRTIYVRNSNGTLAYLSDLNAYLTHGDFNVYSGTTLTNINSKLLTTLFNGYTGTTAPNQFASKLNFNMYTGSTKYASGITVSHGSGSTYKTVQDFITTTNSPGIINGVKIIDNGGSSVVVTSGTTLFRINSGSTSSLVFVDYSGELVPIPPDGALWYLGLLYNNGNPKITLASTDAWNNANQIQVGSAITLPIGTLTFTNQHTASDITTKLIQRFESEGTASRDERIGGLTLGETGTRNIILSSGVIWAKLNSYNISSIDTSGSDALFTFYYSGGTSTGATWIVGVNNQWDNLHYNNITNPVGLVPLTNGYFTNLWFYLSIDTGLIGYVYGQHQYSGATMASQEGPPSFLPPGLANIALLVGRFIIQKSGSTATAIDSVFKVSFNSSVTSTHNNLAGLQGGSTNEYFHLNATKYTVVQNTSGANTGDETTNRINALYGYVPQSQAIFTGFTATTAPATYLKILNFNSYSASTLTNIKNRLLISDFTGYTATTDPSTYLKISNFNPYSASTLTNINTRLLKSDFNTYTGTTAPATYLKISNFNSYSASTFSNINSRLLISAFNTYSGLTLTNINSRLLTNAFNTYSGSTAVRLGIIEASYLTGATNGLSITGKKTKLGGNLTNATQIGLGNNNLTFTGVSGTVRYGSDLSPQYNVRSLVDKGFVTGITSTLLSITSFNIYSGATLTNINSRLLKTDFNTYTGTTTPATYLKISNFNTYSGATLTNIQSRLLTSSFNTYSGNTANLINTKISTANNGLTKAGTNVHLGGALTGATQIGLGTSNITFTATTGTLRYGSDLSSQYNVRSLVDKGFVTGITSTLLTISAFNIYSGATLTNINTRLLTSAFNTYSGNTANLINTKISTANNGLTKAGTNVHLGGTLTGVTQIGLGTNNIIFTGTTGTLRYGSDLSAQYNVRSLVDKGFVTGITSTLLTISNFNVYSGATLTNINTRLVTSTFNTYSGNTANLINTKISTANNGLTKAGTNVHLGGALTGATQIGLGTNNITFTGTTGTLRYGSDLSAQYNVRSLVDKGFVTGITSTLLVTSAFNTYSGNTANLINTKIGSANNGLTKAGTNVHLGGALTGATQIGLGANNLTFTGTTGTLRYGSDLSAQYNVRSLVDKGFVTGITSTLVATANNGLTKSNQNVHLGGSLTGATTIDASTFTFTETGSTGQFNVGRTTGSINIRSRNAVNIFGTSAAGVDRVQLKLAATGATFTDSRTGTTAAGIQYAADYSASYTKRSIIDQAYYTGHTLYTRSQLLVYASGSTNISVATPVSLILNRLIRNDSSVFTYTGGTAIKILQAGTYDVSYMINAITSDGILKSVGANIYKNGVSQVTTTTSGTIGGQTGAGVCLTLSPTEMTFAANDIIQLRGFRLIVPLSGNANTTANGVFISIVKKY